MDASPFWDVYAAVHEMNRPELFLKDAGCRRTVGPGAAIGVRGDSTWNVPEPEIGVVLGGKGTILGYTIANDLSSREIESTSPLYLSQAKVYAGCCAIGPAIYSPEYEPQGFQIVMRVTDEDGEVVYQDTATTAQMTRSFEDLVSWLVRDNPVPAGTVLLTGTGLIPPDDLNLLPGHWVEIHVPEIGTLVNHVVLAADLA
jgi:2-dehydro-3-deoxy-D-arabinonate dehydratase